MEQPRQREEVTQPWDLDKTNLDVMSSLITEPESLLKEVW